MGQVATATTHLLHCIRCQDLIFKAIMAVEAVAAKAMVLADLLVMLELAAYLEEALIIMEFPHQRRVQEEAAGGFQMPALAEMAEMGKTGS